MNLSSMTAAKIASDVRGGALLASDAAAAFLKLSDELEPALNALLHIDKGRVEKADGARRGDLSGVPVLMDDGLCVRGMPTTCASRMLEGWVAPYDSAAVELLEASGAVICGKCNMDEFSVGCSTESSAFGAASNPHDTERTPGGSAGGCAAAVAAGYAPLAFASDTGGSLLQPASFCGVYGLRPTYGLVSRWGATSLAPSMDQLGVFSRTVEDAAIALSVVSRPDPRDETSDRRERPDYVASCRSAAGEGNLAGKRIAIVTEVKSESLSSDVAEAFERVVSLCGKEGAEIIELSLPVSFTYSMPCFQMLLAAEAGSSLARFDGIRYGLSAEADSLAALYLNSRAAGFGMEAKRTIAAGTYILGSERYEDCYLRASSVRSMIAREFADAFMKCDLIVLPTTPSVAFRKGEYDGDPFGMCRSQAFTIQASLASLPSLTMNGADRAGLPAGVQFIAPKWGEAGLLAAASVIERSIGPAQIATQERGR
ncbi:MAG: amidase family protein [Aminobacteriaceae bacterium]